MVILSLATLTILSIRGIILLSKSYRRDDTNDSDKNGNRNKLRRLFRRKNNKPTDEPNKDNIIRLFRRRKRPKDKADKEEDKKVILLW